MSGEIHVTPIGVDAAELALVNIGQAVKGQQLVQALSRLGVRQTKRRIESEKTSPDGARWAPTRQGRGALFVRGRHLAASIRGAATGNKAIWGTGWIGARVHQFGAIIVPVQAKALVFEIGGRKVFAQKVVIPARPYIGVSQANAEEIMDTTQKFLARFLK